MTMMKMMAASGHPEFSVFGHWILSKYRGMEQRGGHRDILTPAWEISERRVKEQMLKLLHT